MAPVFSGVWWGPEAGLAGSGAAAAEGFSAWLGGGGQLVLVGSLATIATLVLLSLLLLLCAGCQMQKKAANGKPGADNENLMNGVSERETFSQSVDSPVTDLGISSSHNGPLTSGTVLTDTQDTSPQPSEELLSSQSELRSSKCHQDRQLPSIPPNSALIVDGPPASGDGTYEVVKELAVASRDVSVEDSLYETVKELKERPVPLCLPNGTSSSRPASSDGSPDPAPPLPPPHHPAGLLNGHLSPSTPERGPLCAGVEYASVDLNKKSRYSADMEAKRRSDNNNANMAAMRPLAGEEESAEEPEEELPPPLPEKVLDENDNQPVVVNGVVGAGLHNGELHSPLSPSPELDSPALSDSESAVYSTVDKLNGVVNDNEDKEHDYSSIAEIKGLVADSSSSDLYATVRDIYPQANGPQPGEDTAAAALDSQDHGYETIRIPKTAGVEDGRGAGLEAESGEEPDGTKAEPDYESVGELGLSRETSRL